MRVFVCVPLGRLRLTRQACAKRHKSATSEYASRNTGKVFSEVCKACLVGAAHLRGESPALWEDGRSVAEVELAPSPTPASLISARALLRKPPALVRRHRRQVLEIG